MEKMLDKLMVCCLVLKGKAYDLVHKEDGAVDIVAIVVLIGIAVVLAVLFRTEIQKVLKGLFNTIDAKSKEAIKD